MGIYTSYSKVQPTKTRKLPYLPRFGFTVDLIGRRYGYKYVPISETILNLVDRGFSFPNLIAVVKEQFAEVKFEASKPAQKKAKKPVKTKKAQSSS